MAVPMIGSWLVEVQSAKPFAIHGDLYVELAVVRVESGEQAIVRVPQHAISGAAPGRGSGWS